jgi:hypothetical protein
MGRDVIYVRVASDPAELLDWMARYEPPAVGKWTELERRLVKRRAAS